MTILNYKKKSMYEEEKTCKGLLQRTFRHLDNRCEVLWAAFCDSHDVLLVTLLEPNWNHESQPRFIKLGEAEHKAIPGCCWGSNSDNVMNSNSFPIVVHQHVPFSLFVFIRINININMWYYEEKTLFSRSVS